MKPIPTKLPPKTTLPISEAAKTQDRPKVKTKSETHMRPYGVEDHDGHVMKSIKHRKPTLWAKIQNWD
jgi:hypothetical protein